MLLGLWDESTEQLTIRRSNGQVYHPNKTSILSGGHKVFGVETVENEVHVLTGPKANWRPTRRVVFSDSGMYKGSKRL